MKYFSVFLCIGFVVLAVFGVFGMHTGIQNHEGGCIAATAQGTDCPKQSNLLDYIAFHLNAFKGFSTATLGENTLAVLLAFALIAIGIGWKLGTLAPPQLNPSYLRWQGWKFLSSPPLQREHTRWLALHENSPALF